MSTTAQSRTFNRRWNCRRAAVAALGADAAFEILEVVGGFAYRAIDVADLPPTRVDGKPKPGPGLARLRANPKAEAIREGAIADQAAEKARQAAKAAIGGTDASIDLPAFLGRAVPAKAWLRAKQPAADPKPATKREKTLGKRAAILAAAQAGIMPTPPDFSAETHKRFRGKLADLVALAAAGDVAGLKAYPINPISSSPKALERYRGTCLIALATQAAARGTAQLPQATETEQ